LCGSIWRGSLSKHICSTAAASTATSTDRRAKMLIGSSGQCPGPSALLLKRPTLLPGAAGSSRFIYNQRVPTKYCMTLAARALWGSPSWEKPRWFSGTRYLGEPKLLRTWLSQGWSGPTRSPKLGLSERDRPKLDCPKWTDSLLPSHGDGRGEETDCKSSSRRSCAVVLTQPYITGEFPVVGALHAQNSLATTFLLGFFTCIMPLKF
jgi:hypothetical protein